MAFCSAQWEHQNAPYIAAPWSVRYLAKEAAKLLGVAVGNGVDVAVGVGCGSPQAVEVTRNNINVSKPQYHVVVGRIMCRGGILSIGSPLVTDTGSCALIVASPGEWCSG